MPGPYRNFYIRERKLRLISAAPFRDRVVHHALCGVLDPIWEQRFIHDTYACRPGKGTHVRLTAASTSPAATPTSCSVTCTSSSLPSTLPSYANNWPA